MTTPKQRAQKAEVALYETIVQPLRRRAEIDDALCAFISTARIAVHDTRGIAVSHGHQSIRDDPVKWQEIEETIWNVICAGHTHGVIWTTFEEQMKKLELPVRSIKKITLHYQTLRAKAA